MQPAGSDPLVRWREAGEWWAGEAYAERRRVCDDAGIVREEVTQFPPLGSIASEAAEYDEDQSEEWDLRLRKTRDEKVAKACGALPPAPNVIKRTASVSYAPLHVVSGYAFGRGTMLALEIPPLAAQAGIPALAIADPISLVGAMEFARSAHKCGIKPIIGASFEMPEGGEFVLLARNASGYRNLCRLITECHLQEPRHFPLCNWERLERYGEDLLCLTGGDRSPLNRLLLKGEWAQAEEMMGRLIAIYGRDHVFAEVERSYLPWEIRANERLLQLAERFGVTPVAGGEITHARRDHFPAQDMLTCVETLCTVEEILGRKPLRDPTQPQIPQTPQRALNAERFLRTPAEMAALYHDAPELLANTTRVVELCEDNVLPSRVRLPKLYANSEESLNQIVFAEAGWRYPAISSALRRRLHHELDRINRRGFSDHFLIAWDTCRWAREQTIQMSGRGSVVDSAVAYCLGLSRIDAFKHNLHFDRFLPEDESKRPDIDIDFEARRRDDVRNYMRDKYGDDKVATVAAVGSYRTRGIVREIGKAMGLPLETVGFLCKRIHGGIAPHQLESALEKRPELRNSNIPKERFQWVFRLAERLMDVPRGIRSHSSGVVLSDEPLTNTVPVMWSGADQVKIIQWDKRSAKFCFDKFDILCLRGQDVLSGTERMVRLAQPGFQIETVPAEDPENFRAMRNGQLIGIPQSASPAMRQAHQRIQTANLHEASLVQAGIRPGVGGAVKLNELIQRKRYNKPYDHVDPKLDPILGLTYGLVVFQEQVDQLLQTFAGYSSGKAEEMREAIHEKRHERFAEEVRDRVHADIRAQGHGIAVSEHVYNLVAGFQGYGFAQGHALAFAEISLRCIYCQQNFPAEYFAALLNAQPAGYYGPCTIANEARLRGVQVLHPDVNFSEDKFSVETVQSLDEPTLVVPRGGIRTGLQQIEGLSTGCRERVVSERRHGLYDSLFDFVARVRPNRDELQNLILSGALDRLETNRRKLLWAIPRAMEYGAMQEEKGALGMETPEPHIAFQGADFTPWEKAVYERMVLGMDVARHLMAFERDRIASKGGVNAAEASNLPHGTRCFVVGHPMRLRFPPTQSGKRVMFFDLEDESGLLNVTCFDETYQRYGHAVICNPYVTIFGEAQHRDGHIAFLVNRVIPYQSGREATLADRGVTTADFLVG